MGPQIQGEFAIVSLASQTGRITTSANTQFDDPTAPVAQSGGWVQETPPIGYLVTLPYKPNVDGAVGHQ